MLKKTIKYTDYNGVGRTEDFYFNLTQTEILTSAIDLLPARLTKGMDPNTDVQALLRQVFVEKDARSIVEIFKKFICMSYGVRSEDGRRFIKTPELLEEFMQTEAFSQLFIEISFNDEAGAAFIKGIIPEEINTVAAKAPLAVTPMTAQ